MPRARLNTPDDKTTEWNSQALRNIQSTVRYTAMAPDRFRGSCQLRLLTGQERHFGLGFLHDLTSSVGTPAPVRRAVAAAMCGCGLDGFTGAALVVTPGDEENRAAFPEGRRGNPTGEPLFTIAGRAAACWRGVRLLNERRDRYHFRAHAVAANWAILASAVAPIASRRSQ